MIKTINQFETNFSLFKRKTPDELTKSSKTANIKIWPHGVYSS